MGLGGNVESLTLPHSQAQVRVTRGLFTTYQGMNRGDYKQDLFVENNGIEPDVHFEHSLDDIRAGYIAYVEAFSKQALLEAAKN